MKPQRYDLWVNAHRVEIVADADNEFGTWVKASEAETLINKLKCCGNCKHNFDADEDKCQGCCEPKLEKWEMRE